MSGFFVSVQTAIKNAVTNLSNQIYASLSASNGAGLVGFLQNGTGAVMRTSKDKMLDFVSVKDFGAKGDGTTDDTAAMQAAHNTGKLIYYPAGTYLFSPTLTMSAGGIIGNGPSQTILKSNDTGTSNLIKYTGNFATSLNVPIFRDFTLNANIAKTNGAGIQFSPTTGETSYIDFRNVTFIYCPIGIDFVAASLWKVIGCDFLAYSVAGIQVANTNTPDSGDSVISGCVFNNPYATGSGIWQKSSGGLKVIGNKFLGGFRGYTMNLEGSTSVLIIKGNSFENMVSQDIAFSQGVAGKSFINVAITGNEFGVGPLAIATDASGFLSEVVISGNIINMGSTGSNACIALNAVSDFNISGNLIKGNGGAGSAAIAVNACANGKIVGNTYANLPNPLSITSSPSVVVAQESQSGSSSTLTTGWTANGAIFQSAVVSVTFPRPFLVAPNLSDITVTSNSGSGTLGGFAIAATTTGFQYVALHSQSGQVATVAWKAWGYL